MANAQNNNGNHNGLRFLRAIIAVLFAIKLTIPGYAQSGPNLLPFGYEVDEITALYESVAFGSEIQLPTAITDRIQKRDPARFVRVMILPQPSQPLYETFTAAAAVIKDIIRRTPEFSIGVPEFHEMRSLTQTDGAFELSDSVFVYIGNRKEILDAITKFSSGDPNLAAFPSVAARTPGKEPMCFTAVTQVDDEEGIRVGFAAVWIEAGPDLDECLYEEVMQSFGIGNDFPDDVPSIFSDDRRYRLPSELDWLIWRIHMDPAMVANMSRAEARRAAKQVISEFSEGKKGLDR